MGWRAGLVCRRSSERNITVRNCLLLGNVNILHIIITSIIIIIIIILFWGKFTLLFDAVYVKFVG